VKRCERFYRHDESNQYRVAACLGAPSCGDARMTMLCLSTFIKYTRCFGKSSHRKHGRWSTHALQPAACRHAVHAPSHRQACELRCEFHRACAAVLSCPVVCICIALYRSRCRVSGVSRLSLQSRGLDDPAAPLLLHTSPALVVDVHSSPSSLLSCPWKARSKAEAEERSRRTTRMFKACLSDNCPNTSDALFWMQGITTCYNARAER